MNARANVQSKEKAKRGRPNSVGNADEEKNKMGRD